MHCNNMTNNENKQELSFESNALLNLTEHKLFLFLAEKVLDVLERENDLTGEEWDFWNARITTYLEISTFSLEKVKQAIQDYNERQAVKNCLPLDTSTIH